MKDPLHDQQVAELIRKQLGTNPDIEQVIVKGDLLQLHVTEALYHRLAVDRERGRKIVLLLMHQMKVHTGLNDVTVRVYCHKEKMIEGKVKPWGGDNVTYLCDL
ncbi:MAG: hypothetical protein D6704_10785 [Nitrospirae bacterium]|nr:MAG: hypothetical protein D6704_10785 [Nitrospirota bacterium]